jgi:MSHA biogenesis protein MshL
MKPTHHFIFSLTISLLFLLTACDTMPPIAPMTATIYPAKPELSSTASSPNPPAAVTDALIPGFNPGLLNESYPSGPATFDISVHEIDAREFFMSLVIDSQENMVVHPDVSGPISLELKNVTVAQVLSAVQKVYGYDYNKTDIGYIIYPATLQTKIFKIDRIDLQREGHSNTRVSSGQISTGSSNSNQSSQSNQSQNSDDSNTSSSGSWITTSSKTDFWDELQQSLAAIVDVTPISSNNSELTNPQTGSKVVINKQTGIVVVRANPTQMREAEKLIISTQSQIGRQVIIEAKILEIILNDEHQDGVNWASVVRQGAESFLMASNPLPATVKQTMDVFTIGVHSGDFYAFIQLMEGQGKTNILSSPRISTLNNQKAVIKVGQDEYFITDVSSDNNSSAATTTFTQDITWTPFFSGIALDVTPQIADDNNITLHIHPSITRVENQTKDFAINGQENSIPMALNTMRESDSIVHAQNGQIIVIGGLMQENRDENQKGVSLLSRIPYLGHAFREDAGQGTKTELVILLKPTVITDNNDWQTPIEDSRQRMEQLEKHELWK